MSSDRVLEEIFELEKNSGVEREQEIRRFIEGCESPVEKILVADIATCFGLRVRTKPTRSLYGPAPNTHPDLDGIFSITVEIQKPIHTMNSSYRADIYAYLTRYWHRHQRQPEWGKLVIEVDGHDYHDRTKEQASRDRKRDREMKLADYEVLRFTGSDVYRDSQQCTSDIEEFFWNVGNTVLADYESRGALPDLLHGPAVL